MIFCSKNKKKGEGGEERWEGRRKNKEKEERGRNRRRRRKRRRKKIETKNPFQKLVETKPQDQFFS